MAVLSMADAERAAAEDRLWAARGKAIQGYASLEQRLCGLMSLSGGMEFDVAATIFFKITAARARNAIIQKLLKKKLGTTHSLFWNSFFKRLGSHLDDRRNQIVHWSALVIVGSDSSGAMKVDVCLKPASYWDDPFGEFERLRAADMIEFEDECDFWSRLIDMHIKIGAGLLDEVEGFDKTPWLAIFQQPLSYPDRGTHPQAHLLATLENQHPPSHTSDRPPGA